MYLVALEQLLSAAKVSVTNARGKNVLEGEEKETSAILSSIV